METPPVKSAVPNLRDSHRSNLRYRFSTNDQDKKIDIVDVFFFWLQIFEVQNRTKEGLSVQLIVSFFLRLDYIADMSYS